MAEFTSDHLHQSLIRPSFPFLDHVFDQTMEDHITQFSGIAPNTAANNSVGGNSGLFNFQTLENIFFTNPTPGSILPPNLSAQNSQANLVYDADSSASHKTVVNGGIQMVGNSNKRKAVGNFDASESSSGISSPPVSESGIIIKTNNGSGNGKKRVKSSNEKEEERPKDVVHVRARRGQATDSHSLAERVRRGKINERLKCLQDIVPGCYKTMGMAVMLDEIINYVQSLQNQVEFLSMKLTAASTFYDFNSETDAVEKLQRAKANEAKEMERLVREGYGGFACFHSSWPL